MSYTYLSAMNVGTAATPYICVSRPRLLRNIAALQLR